jgi:preprotein translocase subunit SecG
MLHTLLTIAQLFAAVCIIVLVLVQRGKGADAGAGFGAGASGTVFGARGATTALSRATAILAAVFMIASLALAYMVTRSTNRGPASVLDTIVEQPASTVPAVPAPASPAPGSVPVVPPADPAP